MRPAVRGFIGRGACFALVAFSGCGESPDAALAIAIADTLDTVNGHPVVVVDAFWCEYGAPDCVPDIDTPASSSNHNTLIARALADALDIPFVSPNRFRAPPCPWRDTADARTGLFAQFVAPPEIEGDGARVMLATGCAKGRAMFEQIHEFVLRRHNGEWVVVRRDLKSIT